MSAAAVPLAEWLAQRLVYVAIGEIVYEVESEHRINHGPKAPRHFTARGLELLDAVAVLLRRGQ